MGLLDNLFNKSEYTKFGITEAQAKELDMLDGKEDSKINGKSIFDVIEEAKESYDSSSSKQKSSFFEYLMNIYKNNLGFSDFVHFGLGSVKFLGNSEPEEVVEQLIEEIYKLGRADLDEPISKISAQNVVEVLQQYKVKSDEKNTIFGKKIDKETLFEAILDESISDKKKKEYITHIKDKLVERINNMNGNAEFISNTFDKILEKVLKKPWGLQDAGKLNQLFDEFLNIIDKISNLNKINSVDKDTKLEISLLGLRNFCLEMGIDTNDLFGNGKLDGNAVQTAGNCILHADINSMLVTDKGRQYLNNLIVKNNDMGVNGNITVFLPGALKLGVPEINPGYFTYSPKELINRSLNTSLGDGDYTALICAVEDCRRLATGDGNATSEGNSTDITVESILFGQEPKILSTENKLPSFRRFGSNDLVYTYDEIKEIFDSENYAITAGILNGSVIKGNRDGQEITLQDNHMYAVVAMDDTTVTLRDSNNPKSLITVTKDEYLKMSSRSIEIFLNGYSPETQESLRT